MRGSGVMAKRGIVVPTNLMTRRDMFVCLFVSLVYQVEEKKRMDEMKNLLASW